MCGLNLTQIEFSKLSRHKFEFSMLSHIPDAILCHSTSSSSYFNYFFYIAKNTKPVRELSLSRIQTWNFNYLYAWTFSHALTWTRNNYIYIYISGPELTRSRTPFWIIYMCIWSTSSSVIVRGYRGKKTFLVLQ